MRSTPIIACMSVPRARRLRRAATDAEIRICAGLRDRRVEGAKFRRQHPIGPYVADFACDELRLVVEIDGGQHAPAVDAKRTAFLEAAGWSVLRFWNTDTLRETEAVLETIRQEIVARRGRR
jgi:very-short-patch-repair endonuclease